MFVSSDAKRVLGVVGAVAAAIGGGILFDRKAPDDLKNKVYGCCPFQKNTDAAEVPSDDIPTENVEE